MSSELTTFSQKLKRLEEIVAQLESPNISLEDGLKLLEEGVALHQQCQNMLTETQVKIQTLLSATPDKSSDAAPTDKPTNDQDSGTLRPDLFSQTESGDEQSSNDEAAAEGLPF